MNTGLEATLSRTVGRIVGQLLSGVRGEMRVRRLRDAARPLMAERTAAGLIDEVSPSQMGGFAAYLTSPEFEQVALQVVIGRMHRGVGAREEHLSAVREQIRHGLRLVACLPAECLLGLTDVVLDALLAAAGAETASPDTAPEVLVALGHVTAAGARNGAFLGRLTDVVRIYDEWARLRAQVSLMHGEMRMPHNGKVRSVPWDRLYVAPSLHLDSREDAAVDIEELTEPGRRHVILGDPGAGKSTLAEKLTHDLAADPDGTVVPLLVVLRHFSAALEAGERTVAEHLVAVCKAPYNVDLTADTVEYLVMNNRAVVIFDGLDELTDIGLRRRVTDLIKGFVLLHPLVPVVATSRRIGYAEASLDPALFRTCGLAPFDKDRVETYARRWFHLDDGAPPAARDRLASMFLKESKPIEDLRSSPLLLSVLCAIYAADHFIPRNRGQVYERCALMVFEQWDQLRGVSRRLGFEGRVRSAVQHLAWTLLTRHAVPEQPRGRIKRILEQHLTGKGFDDDQAAAVAAEFLDYCAGRAWILAEVGSTVTEPIFGFAHRTFLEYFATEYLVRRSRTPVRVWKQLAPRVRRNEWEVVAQLALQLIERNIDDGGDRLLRHAMGDLSGLLGEERDALIAFCARSLGDVCVSPDVVIRVVDMVVDRACGWDETGRFQVLPSTEFFTVLDSVDGPLYTVLYRSLPGNLPFVRHRLTEAFGRRLEADDNIAHFLVSNLSRGLAMEDETRRTTWIEIQKQLEGQYEEACQRWRHRWPWARLRHGSAAADVLTLHGVSPFYVADGALSGAGYPWVVELLVNDLSVASVEPVPLTDAAHKLRDLLVRQPTPWLPRIEPAPTDRTSFTVQRIEEEPVPNGGEDLATRLVLILPYLEFGPDRKNRATVIDRLWECRVGGEPKQEAFELELRDRNIPVHVREFLMRWMRGHIDVVGETQPLR
ncbi:NACHT domain-containing protein [Plantactinospora endophytica]|uniref:NACHT domain-containing protein n=1 Tax=Plantactinospora endophytica TaxID=673535 RepID=UPI00366C270B